MSPSRAASGLWEGREPSDEGWRAVGVNGSKSLEVRGCRPAQL